jgi:hypothetical protein
MQRLDWMGTLGSRIELMRHVANLLVYASVIVGAALLLQLYLLSVPSWLFDSILAGWIMYVVASIALATGRVKAYPLVLVLAIVTLSVSLPQPEHLSLAEAGLTIASVTFIVGSLLQVGVIVLVSSFLILDRRANRLKTTRI